MLRGQHAPLVSILTAASSGHPVPGFFSFSLYRRVCLAQACGRDRGVSARRAPPAPCAGICCPLESAPKLAFFKGKSWWKASAVNRVRVAEPEKIPPPRGSAVCGCRVRHPRGDQPARPRAAARGGDPQGETSTQTINFPNNCLSLIPGCRTPGSGPQLGPPCRYG